MASAEMALFVGGVVFAVRSVWRESWKQERNDNAESCPGKRYRKDCPIGKETEQPPRT
jgi:hypothetical protein